MATDQYTMTDPTTLYADIETKKQVQPSPGLDSKLKDRADLGEETYRGTGRLTDRKALVTGGDSGIGAATAIAFAREGADVAISYLENEESDAQRIIDLIHDAGRKALPLPGDLSDPTYCRNLVAQAVEGLGGLDILVNNAAEQTHVDSLTDLTDEQFDLTMKANIYATFWVTKAALPHLKPGATIINTSSKQAYEPSPDWSTTPPPRPRSTPSPRRWLSSWPRRVSGSTWWRRGRCGPPCRPPAASRRTSCPSSVRTPRSAGRPSRRRWPRRSCSWPRRSRVTWWARP